MEATCAIVQQVKGMLTGSNFGARDWVQIIDLTPYICDHREVT